MYRVIDLDHETCSAANDAELARCVRDYFAKYEPDRKLTDEEVERLIAAQAYDASDS